jgi:serpin B
MSKGGMFPYYERPEFQAVRLSYQGSQIAMYIFLPARNCGLQKFQEILNSAAWESWIQKFDNVPGTLRLPRIKIDCRAELRAALTNLGMGQAFDAERAEFDGIRKQPPPIWIGELLHRAVAEVNEEGTEAAAVMMAVVLGAPLKSQRPKRHFEMIVDRPFLFLIREQQSGSILFIGSVVDPE